VLRFGKSIDAKIAPFIYQKITSNMGRPVFLACAQAS
jgi:hypothetical protein